MIDYRCGFAWTPKRFWKLHICWKKPWESLRLFYISRSLRPTSWDTDFVPQVAALGFLGPAHDSFIIFLEILIQFFAVTYNASHHVDDKVTLIITLINAYGLMCCPVPGDATEVTLDPPRTEPLVWLLRVPCQWLWLWVWSGYACRSPDCAGRFLRCPDGNMIW